MADIFKWLVKFLLIQGFSRSFTLEKDFNQQEKKINQDKHESQWKRIDNLAKTIMKRLAAERNISSSEPVLPPHVFLESKSKDADTTGAVKQITYHDERTSPDEYVSQDKLSKEVPPGLFNQLPNDQNMSRDPARYDELKGKKLFLDKPTIEEIKSIIQSSILREAASVRTKPPGLHPLDNSMADSVPNVHSPGLQSNAFKRFQQIRDPPGLHSNTNDARENGLSSFDDIKSKAESFFNKDPPGLHKDPPGLHASDTKVIDTRIVRSGDDSYNLHKDPPGLHASDAEVIDTSIVRTGDEMYHSKQRLLDPPGLHSSDESSFEHAPVQVPNILLSAMKQKKENLEETNSEGKPHEKWNIEKLKTLLKDIKKLRGMT